MNARKIVPSKPAALPARRILRPVALSSPGAPGLGNVGEDPLPSYRLTVPPDRLTVPPYRLTVRPKRLSMPPGRESPHRLVKDRLTELNALLVTTYAANLDSIRAAGQRIAACAHLTPVMTCSTLNKLAGCELFFKCENLQKSGSFKFRGAYNAVLGLSDEDASRGVVTHSSGNHAQALALAASLRGVEAHLVMPSNAAKVKRRAVEGYGGRVYPCEPTLSARQAEAQRVIDQTGAALIPPYDHRAIIAGQGTIATELIEQVDSLDAIVGPIGGGGMMSGVCIAARAIDPAIRIIAAEPSGADDAARSLAAGRLIPQTDPHTIADGLLTSLGELTWPIIRDHVERIITVTDQQIMAAMRLIWERMKIIIEPSGAVAVAAVLSDEFKALERIKRVGVVLSGGNLDLDKNILVS